MAILMGKEKQVRRHHLHKEVVVHLTEAEAVKAANALQAANPKAKVGLVPSRKKFVTGVADLNRIHPSKDPEVQKKKEERAKARVEKAKGGKDKKPKGK